MVYSKTIAGLKGYNMDSQELRQMSIENARIALEQSKTIKDMETKDDLETLLKSGNYDWKDYLDTNGSDTYKYLLKEIEDYISNERKSVMKLTEDKRKGIETLLAWVEPLKDYRIGSREVGGDIIIDQLKKVLLLEGYDKRDKELLNGLRGLYGKRIEA
jgi:hypothetical protein